MKHPRPSDEELRGMSVNERLFHCGLLNGFDDAARRRDRTLMIELLMQAAATREQAEGTVDTTLRNPEKYGF
tara:strand:- start:405 stop:620 length:216 start_codon:yes stop_codon:yes gene_type:complete